MEIIRIYFGYSYPYPQFGSVLHLPRCLCDLNNFRANFENELLFVKFYIIRRRLPRPKEQNPIQSKFAAIILFFMFTI